MSLLHSILDDAASIYRYIIYFPFCLVNRSPAYFRRKKGLVTRTRRILFCMIVGMFAYATIFMAIAIASLVLFVEAKFLAVNPTSQRLDWLLAFVNAIGTINVNPCTLDILLYC